MMWRIKNIMAYVMLIGMVFAAYVYFCNYYLFLFFLFLLCFLPLSGFMMYDAAKGITAVLIQRTFQAGKNTEQKIQIQVENKRWTPILYANIQLEIKNLFYEKEMIEVQSALLAKSKENQMIPITFQKSGCIEVEISKIIVRDWLHIFQKEIPIGCKEEFMVMPVVVEIPFMEEVYANYGVEENNKTGMKEISDTVSSVRDYVAGDRMQQIHWKISAKKDEILVKEYDHVAKENIKILLELTMDKQGKIDACLDVTYSMVKMFFAYQQPVSLLWWSSRQECMREGTIENEEMLENVMHAIFYEKTYQESNQAYFMMGQAEGEKNVFYVQPYTAESEYIGEKIAVYDNRVIITRIG